MTITHNTELKNQNESDFEESFRFITAMVRAFIRYGGYTFETNLSINRLIKGLGLNGELNASPHFVALAVWLDDENQQRTYMAMTSDTSYNLAKLAEVKNLKEEVINRKLSPKQALLKLSEIENSPVIYGELIRALAFILCGLGFGVILGLSWLNVFLGGLFGLVSWGVTIYASKNTRVAIITELLAAAIVAFLAGILGSFHEDIAPLAITSCAVVWFIPGYGLTVAPREIIYGNTLSGMIYFTNAMIASLKLVGGAIIGIAAARILFPVNIADYMREVTPEWTWIFIPLMVIGLAILFRVVSKDLLLIVIGGWLIWAGVQVGNLFGFWQGPFLGAIILVVFAKFSSIRFRISSSVILLPLILLLVPGYTVVRAMYIAEIEGFVSGLDAGSQAVIITCAILAGIFVGNAIGSIELK